MYLPAGTPFPGLPGRRSTVSTAAKGMPVCFATGGDGAVIKLWRADTGKCVYAQPSTAVASSAGSGIVELAMLPQATGLLTATQDCRLVFSSPAGEHLVVDRQLIGNMDEITDLCFVGAGANGRGAAAPADGVSTPPPQQRQQHAAAAPGLPSQLAVSSNSEQIRLFDVTTLACTATLCAHTGAVLALDVLQLPDGAALLASAGKDATVRLWSLPAGSCVGVGAGHVSAVSCVAFARRGGGFVASGGTDKLLKVAG